MKKRLFQILFVLVAAAVIIPGNLTNEYLRCGAFDTVTICQNDSVRSLSQRYTTDESRCQKLQQAIIEINGLAPDGSGLRAGQQLQIPVSGYREGTKVAEK